MIRSTFLIDLDKKISLIIFFNDDLYRDSNSYWDLDPINELKIMHNRLGVYF